MKLSVVKVMGLLFILNALITIGCKEESNETPTDPIDLDVVITVEDTTGVVDIIATAKNTTEYELYLNTTNEPIEKNETGIFTYTFTKTGIYTIEVRAYGTSGRYIKDAQSIYVLVGSDEVDTADGYATPLDYEGYQLVWQDEFDGNRLNESDWTFEIGDGCPNCGWGNNELQYYRRENTTVANGILTIEARKENFGEKTYTSSRIITKGKQEFRYGRIDIRAVLPEGQGIWPALWMLGANISTVSWPKCGEIDIMELIGGTGKDNTVHGTVHYDINGNHVFHGDEYKLSSGVFSDEFHVFSLIWNETSLKWLMDDNEFYSANITSEDLSEFQRPFFFIFNVAVGGNWPGNPDNSTIFPQQMKVDYVRVFQTN